MKLSEVSIQRPVLATVMSLAIVLFGLLSLMRLPVREYHDLESRDRCATRRRRGSTAAARRRCGSTAAVRGRRRFAAAAARDERDRARGRRYRARHAVRGERSHLDRERLAHGPGERLARAGGDRFHLRLRGVAR